jgi:hypothetical protein
MQKFIETFNDTFRGYDQSKIWARICEAEDFKNYRPEIINCTLTERCIHHSDDKPLVTAIKYKYDTVYMQTLTLALSNPNCHPVNTEEFFVFKDQKRCTAVLIFENAVSIPNENLKTLRLLKPPTNWVQNYFNKFIEVFAFTPEAI